MMDESKLLVVSNRLPVTIEEADGEYKVQPSSGGLVTALDSVLRKHGGTWIGWAGAETNRDLAGLIELASQQNPYGMKAVPLSESEIGNFYYGLSNEVIWPLFHDLQSRCNFDPAYWQSYCTVNQRFAMTAAQIVQPADFVWVHDYHFTLVAKYLRARRFNGSVGFFQHIPFPAPDIFEKLPWRSLILEGMLSYDIVGFQTERDRRNFLACVRSLLPAAKITGDRVSLAGHLSRCSVFPISIDLQEFADLSSKPDVVSHASRIKDQQAGRQIVLGVDRLDYTKGIMERLLAFRHLLATSPELHRAITMIQVVVPSRSDIPKYREMKEQVERLISEINGRFSDGGWIPIVYLYRHLSREELVAYYRAADIALVTPLKDGMNLVAKEYCASQVEHRGVLVLSEFAGAATELKCGALLVNPNDQQAVAEALVTAFRMPVGERIQRMQGLRTTIQKNDVFGWAESFLRAGREMLSKPASPVVTDVRTPLTRAAGVN